MSLSKIFVNNTEVTSIDNNPTKDSENLVRSGGVNIQLKNIDKKISTTNALIYSVVNGLINEDGSITTYENPEYIIKTFYLIDTPSTLWVDGASAMLSALMAELDESDNVLAVHFYGVSKKYDNYPIDLNENTKKVRIFGRTDMYAAIPNIENNCLFYSKNDIDEYLGQHSYKDIKIEKIDGLVASDGKFYYGSGYYSFRTDVTQFKNATKVSIKANDTENAYVSFLIAEPSQQKEDVQNSDKIPRHTISPGESKTLDIPIGTNYIYIDARDNFIPDDAYINMDKINIWHSINDLEESLLYLETIIEQLNNNGQCELISIESNKILLFDGTIIDTSTLGLYVAIYNVSANLNYSINGTSGQDACLAAEIDSNGNVLKVYEPRTSGAAITHYNITTQTDTTQLYIFGRTYSMPKAEPIYYINNLDLEDAINNIVNKKEISILFIGNSLTLDAVSYLPLLMKEIAPDIDFKFYIWYNGGKTLGLHYNDYFLPNRSCDIFSICENENYWTNTSKTMQSILSTYTFDIVSLQEYFNYKDEYTENDLVDFNNCVEYIQTYYNKPFKVVSLFHQPLRSKVDAVYDLTKSGNELILSKTCAESLIPAGIAIYKAMLTSLDSLGDMRHLSPDGTHAQEGLPCLLQAYVVFMWICKQCGIPRSIMNSQTRITNDNYPSIHVPGPNLGSGVITGTEAENKLAQKVATLAFKSGESMENDAFKISQDD